jgi:hypothetical protein
LQKDLDQQGWARKQDSENTTGWGELPTMRQGTRQRTSIRKSDPVLRQISIWNAILSKWSAVAVLPGATNGRRRDRT